MPPMVVHLRCLLLTPGGYNTPFYTNQHQSTSNLYHCRLFNINRVFEQGSQHLRFWIHPSSSLSVIQSTIKVTIVDSQRKTAPNQCQNRSILENSKPQGGATPRFWTANYGMSVEYVSGIELI